MLRPEKQTKMELIAEFMHVNMIICIMWHLTLVLLSKENLYVFWLFKMCDCHLLGKNIETFSYIQEEQEKPNS